jgi:hypothetical protein
VATGVAAPAPEMVFRPTPGRWTPPFRLCDFCRRPLVVPTTAEHLQGCAEYTAYRLDPAAWYREYWQVRGTAQLRVVRVAGTPSPTAPARILATPRSGRTQFVMPGQAPPAWGRLGTAVFNHPDLARSYGAWRLEKLAAEYERLADAFRTGDTVQDEAGHLAHRILTLPR